MVVDTQSGGVAAQHRVRGFEAGWRTDTAWLLAPWLLVTEANTLEPGAEPLRIYRYDLRTGDSVTVTRLTEFPEASLVWDAADGLAVFDTMHLDRLTSCYWTLDVAALAWRRVWCGPRTWIVDWLRLGPGPTVTLRLQEDPHDGLEPCVRLFRHPLTTDEEPTEVPLQTPCQAFSGAGGSDWTAWSEVGLHSEDIGESAGFAQLPDGRVVSLGYVATGSLSACGGWVYWQARMTRPERPTLVRWRPGEDAQLVFEGRSGTLLGRQECNGGWMTIMVAVPGETETVLSAQAD